ncbi:tRNA (adenosine(37)-N6)-dimethylallyltransferase MiaA [Olivibacter sp. SDN3]|uniref:tRNA (adenosine(37)-N6)-dimethylallyltransferase MiaA n=1 Tax=Olivibacter sp. SDN3 TaxID=2764720 RepID=UPI00165169CF|nr:tRNA (adenosine(37)-N6)-dimethylallyltransferase MiaA [Olivibacter sp. SDN3]QNL52525.1 tRNA (adenosine(37)-N6)-dimethylallyltransferase MiaA [Olivibacter sp. SDN3]
MIKTLITIVGPTAIGKTALSIKIAQKFKTAIISADSRQFYREMNIGTAKPSSEELAAAPHFFINSLSIHDDYSAGDFEKEALAKIEELFQEKDQLVLVGGSGLFIKAICEGLDELPKPLPGIREKLNKLHQEKGLGHLQEELKKKDPLYYKSVDINNPQRVIRALEVYESTGKPFSSFHQRKTNVRPFEILKIGLNTDREQLYQRINRRVDQMMEEGLLEEVTALSPQHPLPPLLTVGYNELFDYLQGKYGLEVATEKIKQHTRQFAKRQITWFKKDHKTYWFDPQHETDIMSFIEANIY